MIQNRPALQLEDFGLTSLEFKWHEGEEEGKEYFSNLQLGYQIMRQNEAPHRYRIVLTISDDKKSRDGRIQLTLRATAVGFFVFPESTLEDQQARLIRTVGLPILYSTTRGALQAVSGTLPPDSRYTLPTVNILDLIAAREGPKKEQPVTASEALSPPKSTPGAAKGTRRVANS